VFFSEKEAFLQPVKGAAVDLLCVAENCLAHRFRMGNEIEWRKVEILP
jgi:hypothetical protein